MRPEVRGPSALVFAFALVVGCGGKAPSRAGDHGISELAPPKPATAADRLVRILPDGAQVVIEVDLARLRANAVVGGMVGRALDSVAVQGDDVIPVAKVPLSPLAATDTIVMAAYGVGTSQAGMLALLATASDVPGGRRLAKDVVALGPESWVDQVAARVALDDRHALPIPAELAALRDHAMPPGATGATLRITARLGFDARVALARQTGIEVAPAQLSVWGDVADDLAIVVDADATDPGERTDASGKGQAKLTKELATTMRGAMIELANTRVASALGVPASFGDPHQSANGTWVRTVVAVGPAHLKRVVQRADALLAPLAPPSTVVSP